MAKAKTQPKAEKLPIIKLPGTEERIEGSFIGKHRGRIDMQLRPTETKKLNDLLTFAHLNHWQLEDGTHVDTVTTLVRYLFENMQLVYS